VFLISAFLVEERCT